MLTTSHYQQIHNWCKTQFGTRSFNTLHAPEMIVIEFYVSGVNGMIDNAPFGCYCNEENAIYLFIKNMERHSEYNLLYQVIRTMIHEYCHFTQDLTHYKEYLTKYGYEKNPLELEAQTVTDMYSTRCFNQLFGDIRK